MLVPCLQGSWQSGRKAGAICVWRAQKAQACFSGTTEPKVGSLKMAGHSLGEVEAWLYLWVNKAGLRG